MIYTFLACHQWFQQASFDHWYFTLSFLEFIVTFVEAVILILKHATLLLSSINSKAALTQAELDYQASNIDPKIQEYLKVLSSEDVGQFAGFIKANEIGVFILPFVTTISYQTFSIISVFSESRGINS
jgi:hypothetical protein